MKHAVASDEIEPTRLPFFLLTTKATFRTGDRFQLSPYREIKETPLLSFRFELLLSSPSLLSTPYSLSLSLSHSCFRFDTPDSRSHTIIERFRRARK